MSLVRFSNGELQVHPDYQNVNQISYATPREESNWEKEFWSVVMARGRGHELPLPVMYKNKPCYRGGFQPCNCPQPNGDQMYIATQDMKYILVNVDDIRPPTDREYFKYFRNYVVNHTYVIINSTRDSQKVTELKKCNTKKR